MDNDVLPRPEVKLFAERMELRLRLNDYKGEWKDFSRNYLLARLYEEARELYNVIYYGESIEVVYREATDVANFAMMIAEVAALGSPQVDGGA